MAAGGAPADAEYLKEKGVEKLLKELTTELMKSRPKDPLQFLIDACTVGVENAKQDANGLPGHRADRLRAVFNAMDKDDSGAIEYKEIATNANRWDSSLGEEELREIFRDFDKDGNNKITVDEFLAFFAKAASAATNIEFEAMCSEMSGEA